MAREFPPPSVEGLYHWLAWVAEQQQAAPGGRASLTLRFTEPNGDESTVEIPLLDLTDSRSVAAVQHSTEYDERDLGPLSPVAVHRDPGRTWYSLVLHAPMMAPEPDGVTITQTRVHKPRFYGWMAAAEAEQDGALGYGDVRLNRDRSLSLWDGQSWTPMKYEETDVPA